MRILDKPAVKPILGAAVLLCAVAFSLPAQAYGPHGSRVRIGVVVGPSFGFGYYPYPYYYNPYYANPYYYAPPVVMSPEPTTYVQQSAPSTAQPAPSQGGNYWYYCSDPQGYYPYVQQCNAGWQRVSPTPPQ